MLLGMQDIRDTNKHFNFIHKLWYKMKFLFYTQTMVQNIKLNLDQCHFRSTRPNN